MRPSYTEKGSRYLELQGVGEVDVVVNALCAYADGGTDVLNLAGQLADEANMMRQEPEADCISAVGERFAEELVLPALRLCARDGNHPDSSAASEMLQQYEAVQGNN